jgi:hypothetical protein
MTDARHSSGAIEQGQPVYLGEPAGFVVRLEDGMALYFAGDTSLFGDMRLIGETYKPTIAFLPIGDRFTMGPEAAATACRWLGVQQVVPMHWGTFPVLTGTPAALQDALAGASVQVLELMPGQTAGSPRPATGSDRSLQAGVARLVVVVVRARPRRVEVVGRPALAARDEPDVEVGAGGVLRVRIRVHVVRRRVVVHECDA